MKYYIINGNVHGGIVETDSITNTATDEIHAETWELYCKYPDAYKIEDGKFVALKAEAEVKAEEIRKQRDEVCFPVVNRGQVWYSRLTDAQRAELDAWYTAWLDAPALGVIPETPEWVKL